jgi:superfamily II DNA or RNA helicase
VFLNRVITSTEYIKKREVIRNALAPRWDAIVVDEAHYLAESGTPRNPYTTARARLGQQLRDACDALILLTATPHNGYGHSFRSLLEIVEPTDATFGGDKETIVRRVSRCMVRRLKTQIYKTDKNGKKVPAFQLREPVAQIPVTGLSTEEKDIFKKVSAYCAKAVKAASGTDDSELVSFAMQIIKKRMLSSRKALAQTVAHRLDALKSRGGQDDPPQRAEIRELQGDLPLGEAAHERIAERLVKSAVPKDAKRKNAEKRQLTEISQLLDKVSGKPDPKMVALVADIKRDVLSKPDEKAIIFTEYRDTLAAIRSSLEADEKLKGAFVELTGGLSRKQRLGRMAEFEKPGIRLMLATDAASEGLNLQHHCRRLYHCELPWNPNRMEQRNGRIDRHGQERPPIIRYLFYPDSPEDDLLDRLVKRIMEIQNDKVSTPDILGFLSSARIEEAITGLDAEEGPGAVQTSLFKVIDQQRDYFAKNVAPLLVTDGPVTYGNKIDPASLSADVMVDDDLEFERTVLGRLGSAATAGRIAHTFSMTTPRELRGPGVNEKYPCFTMRRSVAVQYPPADVEFVTRLHPLFQAMLAEARQRLTGLHSPSTPSRRLAVRRHPAAKGGPFAVFTFVEEDFLGHRSLIPVAVDPKGKVLDDGQGVLALDPRQPVGDMEWKQVVSAFEKPFPAIQEAAAKAAAAVQKQRTDNLRGRRKKVAAILREDAESYRVDRLAEIDREEKDAMQAEEKESRQLLLEMREVYGFKARRAAVDTFHKKRQEDIERYLEVPDPAALQPLGVLFVFPPEGKHAS